MTSTAVARARRVLEFPLVRLVVVIGLGYLLTDAALFALRAAGHGGKLLNRSALAAASVLALGLTVRFIERRPFFATLLPRAGAVRDLVLGFALGAALLSASVGVLALAGCYHLIGWGSPTAGGVARDLAMLLMVAVFEETLFRGAVYRLLEETFGSWIALGVSALVFGLVHLNAPGGTIGAAIAVAVEAGVLIGAIFMLRRTLWAVIGLHWAWNFFEGPVFGTLVSGKPIPALLRSSMDGPTLLTGGAFGPEAGAACLVVCTAAGIAVVIHAARRGQVVRPMWRRSVAFAPGPD